MKIICGLGNPGKKYENTRHNAGFMLIDEFAQRHNFPGFKEKWDALASEGQLGGQKILLLKPQTFMNRSGGPLSRFANFYKIDPSSIFVTYDDVDLPLGTIRLREKGGPGTHNGMKSVISSLGSENFPRLRLGVESRGGFAPEEMPLDAFVLAPFGDEEMEHFKDEVDEGIQLLEKTLAS